MTSLVSGKLYPIIIPHTHWGTPGFFCSHIDPLMGLLFTVALCGQWPSAWFFRDEKHDPKTGLPWDIQHHLRVNRCWGVLPVLSNLVRGSWALGSSPTPSLQTLVLTIASRMLQKERILLTHDALKCLWHFPMVLYKVRDPGLLLWLPNLFMMKYISLVLKLRIWHALSKKYYIGHLFLYFMVTRRRWHCFLQICEWFFLILPFSLNFTPSLFSNLVHMKVHTFLQWIKGSLDK